MPRRVVKTAIHRSGHGQVSIILTAPPPTLAELRATGSSMVPNRNRTSVLNVHHVPLPPLSRIRRLSPVGNGSVNKLHALPGVHQTSGRPSVQSPQHRRFQRQGFLPQQQNTHSHEFNPENTGASAAYSGLETNMNDGIDDVIEATLNDPGLNPPDGNIYAGDDADCSQQFVGVNSNHDTRDQRQRQNHAQRLISNETDMDAAEVEEDDTGDATNAAENADDGPEVANDHAENDVAASQTKRDTSNEAIRFKRHATLCFFKTGDKPQVIQQKLKMVYGKNAPSKNAVYRWIAQFREGNEDIEYGHRGGSRVTERTQKFATLIKDYIQHNREATIRDIGMQFGLATSSVYEILKNRIHYRKRGNKWTAFDAKESKKAPVKASLPSSAKRTAKISKQQRKSKRSNKQIDLDGMRTAESDGADENANARFSSDGPQPSLYLLAAHARGSRSQSGEELISAFVQAATGEAASTNVHAVNRSVDASQQLNVSDQYRYRLISMPGADGPQRQEQLIFVTADGNEAVDIVEHNGENCNHRK